jgi:hypothetical protein
MDMMRLAAAAREVQQNRIAELSMQQWIATDTQAIIKIKKILGDDLICKARQS